MLKELTDDGANPDPIRDARQARLDRTGAADDQLDVDARDRRLVQRFDDRDVDDGIEFQDDARRSAGCRVTDLALDEVEEPRPQAVRSDE